MFQSSRRPTSPDSRSAWRRLGRAIVVAGLSLGVLTACDSHEEEEFRRLLGDLEAGRTQLGTPAAEIGGPKPRAAYASYDVITGFADNYVLEIAVNGNEQIHIVYHSGKAIAAQYIRYVDNRTLPEMKWYFCDIECFAEYVARFTPEIQ